MNNKKTALTIKALLQERGKTAKEMIEEKNLNKNFMYSIEHGSIPSVDKMEKVADYLEVSIDELLGRKEAKTNIIANENTITNGNNIYYVEQMKKEEVDTNKKELIDIYNKISKKRKLKLMEKAYELEEEEHMSQGK